MRVAPSCASLSKIWSPSAEDRVTASLVEALRLGQRRWGEARHAAVPANRRIMKVNGVEELSRTTRDKGELGRFAADVPTDVAQNSLPG
ncbi:hypothetical protein AB5I41_14270 [Sphingomonas sp. MMS24-JH45]